MTQRFKEEYPGKIKLLAEGLKSHPPGKQIRLVLFLGAGAPRAAGLPLADRLKNDVIAAVFGERPVPEKVRTGRLEDLMQTLQASLGNEGYELVARIIREFKQLPPSYGVIRDLITDGYVEAVVTTNFDVLFDVMAAYAGLRLYFMTDDDSFQTDIPKDATLVARLHGCAVTPITMKGSWTDVDHLLPAIRQEVLKNLMETHITVFVGYSARDNDIVAALDTIAGRRSTRPIWWVDPHDEPTDEIQALLRGFGCVENYLPIDSEHFFGSLAQELAPQPHPQGEEVAHSLELIRRIQASDPARDFLGEREMLLLRTKQEQDFEGKVNDICFQHLRRYVDNENRTVLNQMASESRPFSDVDSHEFDAIVEHLGLDRSTLRYTCAKVGSPKGCVELVLQPCKGGRGGGLTHEFWFHIVAAVFFFRDVNPQGSAVGKGVTWDALIRDCALDTMRQSVI